MCQNHLSRQDPVLDSFWKMKSYKTFCENINGRFFLKYACTAVKLVCYSMHFSIWKRNPLLFLNIVISIMTRSPRIIHNENGENSAYE